MITLCSLFFDVMHENYQQLSLTVPSEITRTSVTTTPLTRTVHTSDWEWGGVYRTGDESITFQRSSRRQTEESITFQRSSLRQTEGSITFHSSIFSCPPPSRLSKGSRSRADSLPSRREQGQGRLFPRAGAGTAGFRQRLRQRGNADLRTNDTNLIR